MKVVELIEDMMNICESLRKSGKCIRLVPTMGALHKGHESLIDFARKHCFLDRFDKIVVIVSIFVNPIQFNDKSDFLLYPKTLEADLHICEKLNVDYVFHPSQQEIYPNIMDSIRENCCQVRAPNFIAYELEGKSRPGHFEGMLTIVCKLFNIINPHKAYFGEKDYQQMILVTKMVDDLNMKVDICPVETVRDERKLPLSSRNVRLSQTEREVSFILYEILTQTKSAIQSLTKESHSFRYENIDAGKLNSILYASALTTICIKLTEQQASLVKLDYLELRCSKDLASIKYDESTKSFICQKCSISVDNKQLKTRLLISILIGKTRLLDNIEVILN